MQGRFYISVASLESVSCSDLSTAFSLKLAQKDHNEHPYKAVYQILM